MSRKPSKENLDDGGDNNHELYGKGCAYYNKEDYRNAIKAFSEALEYWPEDGQAWLALGNCYDSCQKPRRAEQCYRKAVQFSTNTGRDRDSALYNLGNSLYDQLLFSEAIECYEKVSKSSKAWGAAKFNRQKAANRRTTFNTKSNKSLKRDAPMRRAP